MYGITEKDIEVIDNKIYKQKLFLINGFIDIPGSNKNLLDNTYSANLNPKKYFAEINNRVNTMFFNAKEKGLKPVFVTLTAPSKYHKKNRSGFLKTSPNETAKELTQIWNKFTNLQVFQKMKKELGHGLVYFRVYEPHKSGVPHLHAMIFIPSSYILQVKKKYEEYFSSNKWGANSKAIDFKFTWDKNGGGAVGYIMKYITKTFKDEDNKKTQYAVYWYIKHKIRRFLSSRTLAPLEIYRKVRYFFKNKCVNDFQKVTSELQQGVIKKLFDNTELLYIYYNHDTGEVEEKILWGKNTDLLLKNRASKEAQSLMEEQERQRVRDLKEHRKKQSQNFQRDIKVFENKGDKYTYDYNRGEFKKLPVITSRLKDYQLMQYFRKLDNSNLEDVNIQHYLLTKNEMIKRGLLKGEIQPLNISTEKFGF